MAGELFGRLYRYTHGTTLVTGQRLPSGAETGFNCAFEISRDLKPQPNTATIRLWNLDDADRAVMLAGMPIQFEAGYASAGTSILFVGNADLVQTRRDGPSLITTITGGDGSSKIAKARISKTIGAGSAAPASVFGAAGDALKAVGFNAGNVDSMVAKFDAASSARLAKLGKLGVVLDGSAAKQMQTVTRSVGLEYSIQADKLQVLERNKALAGTAVILDAAHGLIGSPEVESKGKSAGRVKAVSLIQQDLAPGRLVTITSDTANGTFRVETCRYAGEYRGSQWYATIEGGPY